MTNEVVPPYWGWGFWWSHLIHRQPGFVIGGIDNPYLLRYYLVPRNPFLNVYLHKFLRSDDDRALHDHPWHFLSLVLKGGYREHREGRPLTVRSYRQSGSFAFRKAGTLHRVELDTEFVRSANHEKPCWTLIVTGPKIRDWGFLCPGGWIHWKQFDAQNGCGEV